MVILLYNGMTHCEQCVSPFDPASTLVQDCYSFGCMYGVRGLPSHLYRQVRVLRICLCSCTGCLENELGLRKFLEDRGHTLVVTDDKEGADSQFEKELEDADVVCGMSKPTSQAPHMSLLIVLLV